MSTVSLLDTSCALMRLTRLQAQETRKRIRQQRAAREERAFLDDDDLNEAFRAFAKNRDLEDSDDAMVRDRIAE